MSLRVIAGQAKGRRLKRVPGDTTRPIMDRVKEALFSIIGRDIVDATFLDLFAGTGSIGIEALSRGAKQVIFVDREGPAIKTIHQNLEITGLSENAIVRRTDAFTYLKHPPAIPFDYIYIAPPQYKNMWLDALNTIDSMPDWVEKDTEIIVQIDPKEFNSVSFKHIEAYDERKYGKTLLVFYTLKDELEEE